MKAERVGGSWKEDKGPNQKDCCATGLRSRLRGGGEGGAHLPLVFVMQVTGPPPHPDGDFPVSGTPQVCVG